MENLSERYDVAIIGGGIKGLFTVKSLVETANRFQRELRVCIIERNPAVGQEMSRADHNSGVGHSGQYYGVDKKKGSPTLKAVLNSRGFDLTKRFCVENGIHIDETGKLTVGYTEESKEILQRYRHNAIRNGRDESRVHLIHGDEAREMEPNLSNGVKHALLIEETFLFQANEIIEALMNQVTELGVAVITGNELTSVERLEDGYRLVTQDRELSAKYVVNQAGAQVNNVAKMLGGGRNWGIVPVQGNYMLIPTDGHIVSRPIYQVPDNPDFPFLDPHAMPHDDGVVIGPTAMPTFGVLDTNSTFMDALRENLKPATFQFYARLFQTPSFLAREMQSALFASAFRDRAQRIFDPSKFTISSKALQPYKSGIRGQLILNGHLSDDFCVERRFSKDNREMALTFMNPGSPGFTAAPAIAEYTTASALQSLEICTPEEANHFFQFNYFK